MKITVEMKSDENEFGFEYFIVEDATAIYVEADSLEIRQDKEMPGYRMTEKSS